MSFLDKYKIKEEEEKIEKFNEIEFQKAYKKYAIEQGLSLDPYDPEHFYDYKALWDEEGEFKVDKEGHLPSKHKLLGHPREVIGGMNTITGKIVSGGGGSVGVIEEEEEEFSFLKKYKFTPTEVTVPTQFGIGAKAEAGISLTEPEEEPETLLERIGVKLPTRPEELKMGIEVALGTWEEQKLRDPELQETEDLAKEVLSMKGKYIDEKTRKLLDMPGPNYTSEQAQIAYIYELLTTTETEKGVPMEETIKDMQSNLEKYGSINPPRDWKKAFKEEGILKTALIGPSEKYGQAESIRRGFIDIIIKKESPGADLISSIGWKGMILFIGSQAIAGLMDVTPEIWRKLSVKVENKKVSFKEGLEAIRKIGEPAAYGKSTPYQRKIFDEAVKQADIQNISIEKMLKKGITLAEVKPRFAFGGKLYAGVPIDEMVKSIVSAGKLTQDIINQLKVMNPVDTGLVFQQLSIASPAIASKVASEFVDLIPQKIKKIPKVEEEMTPEELEELEKLREVKVVPEEEIEPTKVELEAIEKPEAKKVEYQLPAITGIETEYPIHFYIKSDVVNKFKDAKTFKRNIEKARKTFVADKELNDLSNYNIEEEFGSLENYYNWVKQSKAKIKGVEGQYDKFIDKLPIDEKTKATWKEDPENLELNYKDYLRKIEKPITPKEEFMAKMEEVKKAKEPVEVIKPVEKIEPEVKVDLATPKQIKKAHAIANTKALISEKGKMKPQYRKIAEIFTGKRSVKDMTPEEAEMFINQLNRLPEPKYRAGKLVPPSIPRTMKLTTLNFFKKVYGEPTPIWLLTDQTYYATKLGIKPLVEPFEKGKMGFDLEFRKSSHLVDKMVNKINTIAKTSAFAKIKSKIKNIPTKAESNMAELLNKHEATPSGLTEKEEDVFKYFRNLSKDIWRRENEVREKVDLPPIKYKQAYFRHTADVMAKEMLEGKYPFPQGIKYWGEKMVGKKIFNPMEFHRKLSDDLIDLWSKDIRAVTKAMLWSGLKEIYLAQPAKFLNEQLNAISKDLPEYKNLSPRDQAAYDQTRVMPSSTKKWLVNYVNQVIKGQETELDASLNRIVTKSGLKGIFDKVLSPFGRAVGRKPITNIFMLSGRAVISGVMGWVPRQIMRNSFQPIQNLALYGVKATIKAYLPASVDKNLKGLMSESLFLKSYTGFEELPTDLMGKLEKMWLGPYGIVAVNNAKLGMKAAYWNTIELIRNPKFKKHGWADSQRTKDTPKGFLYPGEKGKLLKEMEFGASATQYQYIPMGMPGVFRYKALIPLTRLQSWWMNYFTKFNREALHRGFKGRPSWSGEDGPTLPWSRRVNYLKYVIIGGAILTALGYRKSFMLGVAPVYLSPAGQVALGMYSYVTADEDWKREKALRQIYYSWKAFIPGSLAWRDFLAVWKGEKELNEILFYGKKEEKEKEPVSPYIKKYKEEAKPTESPYLKKYKR